MLKIVPYFMGQITLTATFIILRFFTITFVVISGDLWWFVVVESWWFCGGFVVVCGGFVVVHGGFMVVFCGGFVVVCGGFSPKISRKRSCDPLFNQTQTQIHYEISFLMRLLIYLFPFEEHTSIELC